MGAESPSSTGQFASEKTGRIVWALRWRAAVQSSRCGSLAETTAAWMASSRKLPPTILVVVLRLRPVAAKARQLLARAGHRW